MRTRAARKRARGLRLAEYIFLIAGILALGYCLVAFFEAKLFEARESRNFAQELRGQAAQATHSAAPVPRPKDGGIVGRLEIPRIGVSVMVVEGADGADLKRAAGHIPGTPFPDETGNVGIAAHRDTFFRPLRFIHPNDTITLSTLRGVYNYRVVSTQVVKPNDVQVLKPTKQDTLTLVTCFPFYYVGSAPNRFIVRAARLDSAVQSAKAGLTQDRSAAALQ